MVVSNSSAGSGSQQGPAVSNPYLTKLQSKEPALSSMKNNASTVVFKAASKPTENSSVSRSLNNTVTPVKPHHIANKQTYQSATYAVKSGSNRQISVPEKKIYNPNVTPTPKKGMKVSNKHMQAIAGLQHEQHKLTPKTMSATSIAKPRVISKAKPTTLKSQLKSQIAALKNQKKQRLLQKEKEKELALREAERIKNQQEMLRLQKIREEERKERERKRAAEEEIKRQKATRREIGGYLLQIIKRVEGRIQWEKKRGIPYEIGEVVQSLLCEVERKNRVHTVMGGHAAVPLSNVVPFQPMFTPICPYDGNRFNPWYQHTIHKGHLQPPPLATTISSFPIMKAQKSVQPKPLLLHANPMNKHSPFRDSYELLDRTVCMTKKVGDSFGVTLRFECRSVLVPREDCSVTSKANLRLDNGTTSVDAASAVVNNEMTKSTAAYSVVATCDNATATSEPATQSNEIPSVISIESTSNEKPKKKRRTRINYGVLVVTDSSKATFVPALNSERQIKVSTPVLKPGDIILEINGRNIGGLAFSDACKSVSITSVKNEETGVITCRLKVARLIPNKDIASVGVSKVGTSASLTTGLALLNKKPVASFSQPIPYIAMGNRIIGEFTSIEWRTLVHLLCSIRCEMSTGMALEPVTREDIIKKISQQKNVALQQRSLESITQKLAYESEKVIFKMNRMANEHWASSWKLEIDNDKDNENNDLFEEPLTDAKRSYLRSIARPANGCKCGSTTHDLVSDPKCVLYRDVKLLDKSSNAEVETILEGAKKMTKNNRARNAMEAAYIERFIKLRAETEAAKREAEFVLNMELKQISEMKKAVLSPLSLCTVVLSAVASLMDVDPDSISEKVISHDKVIRNEANNYEDDSDEDLPLNALAPDNKRPKLDNGVGAKKNTPSTITLAKLLKHISETYGHIFQEPTHVDYAWQQRSRSVLTAPLPREVMFKGNLRKPGNLSFENIQFMLNDDCMTRLNASNLESLHDQWVVTYLASDEVTGLYHEIDVLETMGILQIDSEGNVSLAPGWQKKVTHHMLIEMKDGWGTKEDVHNLYCVNDTIRSLSNDWEYIGGEGWRSVSKTESSFDDEDLDFDDEEYELRKQIFSENYNSFVNEQIGFADFGL